MNAPPVGLFDLADKRLQWLTTREGVLAENVANADTPGWKSRDLKPFADVLANSVAGRRLSLASVVVQTNPMHMPGTLGGDAGAQALRGEQAPDGNAVSLDRELEKIAQTDSDHEAVTAIYHKYIGMFREALGR